MTYLWHDLLTYVWAILLVVGAILGAIVWIGMAVWDGLGRFRETSGATNNTSARRRSIRPAELGFAESFAVKLSRREHNEAIPRAVRRRAVNTLTEIPPDEEIEAGSTEVILLRYARSWPHSTVEWTLRRQNLGSQSFPIQAGVVRSESNPPDWAALRADALAAAEVSREAGSATSDKAPNRSLLGKLLARR